MEKDRLYIVLTRTGTLFSKAIRVYTKEEYNHVSISFYSDLSSMYSMSRGSHYNPLSACLKKESPYRSFLKYYEDTKCLILSFEIPMEKKVEIQKTVEQLLDRNPKYNMLGILLYTFGVSFDRDNHYFCSEFVDRLLKANGISFFNKESGLVRPEDFRNIPNLTILYEGYLKDYKMLNREERFLYDSRSCGRYEQTKYKFLQGFMWIHHR